MVEKIQIVLFLRRFTLVVLLAFFLMLAGGAEGQGINRKGLDGLKPIPLAGLSHSQVTNFGKKALSIRTSEWQHSETDNFIYHYFDSFIATPVSVEAESYYRYISNDLGKSTANWERKCHIFIFQTRADWTAFVSMASLDPWTGGVHSQGELFILREPEYKFKGGTLAHEVAHLVMDRFYNSSSVPLWLNEGYAEYAGTRAYASWSRLQNYAAKPKSRSLNPKDIIPLVILTNAVDYPDDLATVNIFYIQSHRLVRFLTASGKTQFNQFLEQISQGKKTENALSKSYGSRFATLTALEKEFTPYAIKDYDGRDE